MTFINEIIPEEAKTSFTFPVKTLRDGSKPTLYMWTVNKEKNVCLVHTNSEGGSYEGTTRTEQYVVLMAKTVVASLKGFSKVSGNMQVGQILNWKLNLQISKEVTSMQRDEIECLVRDAFDAMGLSYLRDCLNAVVVDFVDLSSIDLVDSNKQ